MIYSLTLEKVKTKVLQGSILRPLLFLVYKSHLADDLTTNTKDFEEYTSLFSFAHDSSESSASLNDDLHEYLQMGLPMEDCI